MIRQGFQNPILAQGARLPTHTWRLSDPKMYVSARDMFGATADVGRQIGASLQGIGNNIRQDRQQQELWDRQDAVRAENNARSDARYADQKARQDRLDQREDERFQWDKEKHQDLKQDRNQQREARELTIMEKQQRLDAAKIDRQFEFAKRFSERAAAVKNPNEWNQLIDYFKSLGYQQAESYRDYNSGRQRAISETRNVMEDLKRRKLMLQNQKLERENQIKGKPADDKAATNIAAGLSNLARIPDEAGRWSFESSVGPLQGDQDALLGPLARAGGSILNMFGNQNTTEIRSRVEGDVEALAAAIKPLIRKPGEGPWTDSDQRRLVAVVGSLTQARTVEEYKRGLENVRQRIMSNFGMQIPPIPGITPGTNSAPQSQAPSSVPSGVKITVREN